MLGFCPFASAPFASTGSGAIISVKADFIGEAIINANANVVWVTQAHMLGKATLKADSTIAGSGWVRQNPEGEEWDVTKSSDWDRIN